MPITWNEHDSGLQLSCPSCGQTLEAHLVLVGQASRVTCTLGVQTVLSRGTRSRVTQAAAAQPPRARRAPLVRYGLDLFGRAWDGWTPADDLQEMD